MEELKNEMAAEDPLQGISLQSLIGFTNPKTMKMEGSIEGNTVLVLIDSGATSNISTSVARRLGFPCTDYKPFGVTLGTGTKVYGEGICRQVYLSSQGVEIVEDFFYLELGSLDVILGVQWLEKLGTFTII